MRYNGATIATQAGGRDQCRRKDAIKIVLHFDLVWQAVAEMWPLVFVGGVLYIWGMTRKERIEWAALEFLKAWNDPEEIPVAFDLAEKFIDEIDRRYPDGGEDMHKAFKGADPDSEGEGEQAMPGPDSVYTGAHIDASRLAPKKESGYFRLMPDPIEFNEEAERQRMIKEDINQHDTSEEVWLAARRLDSRYIQNEEG